MTSAEIRQSFLDFFRSKQHSVVPSSSLLPTAPNLLFTNAGMNQFVPYFLGEQPAPWKRVVDTQKCIRAGGKHNDLEDVGLDTYHHTFFEMLGNWSFGDYFKRESLTWGWELLTHVWGIPPKRLFATVYSPDKSRGDPAGFDQEASEIWTGLFRAAGLDPAVHLVHGGRKDNFWMMGDTGPCGPCSEIHFNLLPGDTASPEVEKLGRALVNAGSPRCIEIWNHVFIQFNANPDGSLSPLAARHIDTGMGFERVAGIHATTRGFQDFTAEPSNYNADVFLPAFEQLARLSGSTYHKTVPVRRDHLTEMEQTDIAYRVVADHSRCVACAIADGILPGNDGRNYVIRRILRRGIMYGRKSLGLKIGDFTALVEPVVRSLGDAFPELKTQRVLIERAIQAEEESFGRTLDKGLEQFHLYTDPEAKARGKPDVVSVWGDMIPGWIAFMLYDTYGFPLDMTQLLAQERGLKVDVKEFENEMAAQRSRGRAAQKKDVIVGATEGEARSEATRFVGYEIDRTHATHAKLVEVVRNGDDAFLVFDETPFYAEMGGQVGDTGHALVDGQKLDIIDCIKDKAGRHLHKIGGPISASAVAGASVTLHVDVVRRRAISRHHSSAHLIHWALRKMLGTHVRQFGTHKTPDRMRFDFTHFEALTAAQVNECEQLVNEKVIENTGVESFEIDYDKKPADVLAFFGDKYGKRVRVVDIGGFSKELCGGTHVRTTGEIGIIKIVAEMAIAAGTRRIEAVCGQAAFDYIVARDAALAGVTAQLSAGPADVTRKLEIVLAHQKELEKRLKVFADRASAGLAADLAAGAALRDGLHWVSAVVTVESPDALRSLGNQVLHQLKNGVVQLGAVFGDKVSVVAFCSPAAIQAGVGAGKLVAALSGKLGGKGGGKPDFAMGGGRDASKLAAALEL